MPTTRFYLPSTGAAAVSPVYSAYHSVPGGIARRPLVPTTPSDTAFAAVNITEATDTSPYTVLGRQFIGPADLVEGVLSGTVSAVIRASETAADADASMTLRVLAYSGDGIVLRGVLYDGTMGSELATTAETRIVNAGALNPVIVQAGDRFVVEIGATFLNVTTSSRGVDFNFGDVAASSDYALADGLTAVGRPWIELTTTTTPLPDACPTGYRVRLDGGAPDDVGLTFSNLFTGLIPDTGYDLEVQAYNDFGDSEWVLLAATTLPSSAECDDCEDVWLIESCNLFTGVVQNVLTPTGFEFQVSKNAVGQGSMTFPTKGVRVQDIWPNLSLIAVSRVGDTEGLFLGIVESFEAASGEDGGTTSIGMTEITSYLWHRLIRADYPAEGEPLTKEQTVIARDLVDLTIGEIPLNALASPSAVLRTLQWLAVDRPVIGDEIENLTTALDGPDWEVIYTKSNGAWSATMRFADEIGVQRDIVLSSDAEGASYSLTVDGSEQATRIDGFAPALPGEEETSPSIVTVEDTTGPYPLLETAISYTELPIAEGESPEDLALQFAAGDLAARREPTAVPAMTIVGHEPDPSVLRLGDEVTVHIEHGAITYHGQTRVVDISWAVEDGSPDLRTIQFEPISRPSEAILSQYPSDDCEDC